MYIVLVLDVKHILKLFSSGDNGPWLSEQWDEALS